MSYGSDYLKYLGFPEEKVESNIDDKYHFMQERLAVIKGFVSINSESGISEKDSEYVTKHMFVFHQVLKEAYNELRPYREAYYGLIDHLNGLDELEAVRKSNADFHGGFVKGVIASVDIMRESLGLKTVTEEYNKNKSNS